MTNTTDTKTTAPAGLIETIKAATIPKKGKPLPSIKTLEAKAAKRNAKAKAKRAAKAKQAAKAKAPAKAKAAPAPARKGSKLEKMIEMMRSPKGATLAEMAKVTGWQVPSVRGVIYNAVRGRLGLTTTMKADEKRGTVFTLPKAK